MEPMLASNEILSKPIPPFLKWAGGKRWLTSRYSHLFPEEYSNYLEPFLGGGAVFFYLAPEQAVLGDLNEDLVNLYTQIKLDWSSLLKILKEHHNDHSETFYYDVRKTEYESPIEKAAQFLYLNRTCWNGLYRVNLNGKFNVPIGTKNNVLMESDDFESISKLLSGVELMAGDFSDVIDRANFGDFIFVDPPYCVDKGSGFTKYNKNVFGWQDQVRLQGRLLEASERGVKIMLTNIRHESTVELFSEIGNLINTERKSVISGGKYGRGEYQEIIVRNYS